MGDDDEKPQPEAPSGARARPVGNVVQLRPHDTLSRPAMARLLEQRDQQIAGLQAQFDLYTRVIVALACKYSAAVVMGPDDRLSSVAVTLPRMDGLRLPDVVKVEIDQEPDGTGLLRVERDERAPRSPA